MPLSTSTTLAALVRSSHIVTARAVATNGATSLTIPILEGSIQVDARSNVRRTLSLQTVDLDGTLTPTSMAHPLAPFGSEITVWRSATDPATGTTYEIQQGVFRITSTELTTDDMGTRIAIQASDRAAFVAAQSLSTSISLSSGVTTGAAITQILNALPSPIKNWARGSFSSSYTIDLKGLVAGVDLWQAIVDLSMAEGREVYYDTGGTIQQAVIPTLPTVGSITPTWSYLEDATNVVLSVKKTLDGNNVSNGVLLIGSGTDLTSGARGEAYDTNLSSPTQVQFFGKRVVRMDSSYVKTPAQATAVAAKLLNLYIGQPVEFEMIPNPAMDVRDLVQIQSTRLGMNLLIVVDGFTLPLAPGATMSVSGRALTV